MCRASCIRGPATAIHTRSRYVMTISRHNNPSTRLRYFTAGLSIAAFMDMTIGFGFMDYAVPGEGFSKVLHFLTADFRFWVLHSGHSWRISDPCAPQVDR